MQADHLRDAKNAMPFRPFILRMADGRFFFIPHPDFLSISPTGRIATVYEANDSAHTLDVPLMTGIETVASSPHA